MLLFCLPTSLPAAALRLAPRRAHHELDRRLHGPGARHTKTLHTRSPASQTLAGAVPAKPSSLRVASRRSAAALFSPRRHAAPRCPACPATRRQADILLQGELLAKLSAGETVAVPVSLGSANPAQPDEAMLNVQLMLLRVPGDAGGRGGCVAGARTHALCLLLRAPMRCEAVCASFSTAGTWRRWRFARCTRSSPTRRICRTITQTTASGRSRSLSRRVGELSRAGAFCAAPRLCFEGRCKGSLASDFRQLSSHSKPGEVVLRRVQDGARGRGAHAVKSGDAADAWPVARLARGARADKTSQKPHSWIPHTHDSPLKQQSRPIASEPSTLITSPPCRLPYRV